MNTILFRNSACDLTSGAERSWISGTAFALMVMLLIGAWGTNADADEGNLKLESESIFLKRHFFVAGFEHHRFLDSDFFDANAQGIEASDFQSAGGFMEYGYRTYDRIAPSLMLDGGYSGEFTSSLTDSVVSLVTYSVRATMNYFIAYEERANLRAGLGLNFTSAEYEVVNDFKDTKEALGFHGQLMGSMMFGRYVWLTAGYIYSQAEVSDLGEDRKNLQIGGHHVLIGILIPFKVN